MNPTDTPLQASTGTLSDLSASDKHCVFRSGTSWFSVPAVSVREITIAPDLVRVPQCHPSLAGLCHLRSEFIPVISLASLPDIDASESPSAENKLMVINGNCIWSLLIAEAAALESLETIVTPEARIDDVIQSPVMGTAMFRDQIVRVLDPVSIFRLVQQSLEGLWNGTNQPHPPIPQ
jgi:chemotaxis signal transduction protein